MSSWESEIRQIEDECRLAFLAQDVERLRRMWADDLAVNSPLNRVNSREQGLDLLQRGIIRHASMDQKIEQSARHGDVVDVMGKDTVKNPGDPAVIHRR